MSGAWKELLESVSILERTAEKIRKSAPGSNPRSSAQPAPPGDPIAEDERKQLHAGLQRVIKRVEKLLHSLDG